MKTIIFKSEKKAKIYKEVSNINQGVYKENEVLRTVKTDDTEQLQNKYYKTSFEEVK